jgi:hypothetical protein
VGYDFFWNQRIQVSAGMYSQVNNGKDLLAMVESSDVEGFTEVIVDFDKLTKLDNWKTSLLLRVKKTIVNEEMDFT